MTNKLQLYIAISHNGFKQMADINADASVKAAVCDLSPAIGLIDFDAKQKNIFYMLRYVSGGVFVVLIRTIPSSKPHHLAAWVFIPSHITVSGPEIEDVMDSLVQAVSQPKITAEIMQCLRRMFAKDYAMIPEPGRHVANYGSEYAHRFYGDLSGYTLSDLIGKQRYQVSYLPFAGVLLVDKEVAGAVNGVDLSDEPLEQVVKLLPPISNGSEYEPMIFGVPFTVPFLVTLMGTVEIRWMSPVRPELKQSVMVNRPNMRIECIAPAPIPAPEPVPAPAPVPPVPAAAPEPRQIEAPAEHAQERKDDTSAPAGEQPDTSEHESPKPAAAPAHAAPVPAAVSQSEAIAPEDEDHRSFWVERATQFLDTSNHAFALKCGAVGFLLGVMVTLLCQWMIPSGAKSNAAAADADSVPFSQAVEADVANPDQNAGADAEDKIEEAIEEVKPEEKPEPQPPTLQDALRYLDSNTTWTKERMESFPALKGLYADMNAFNTRRIVSYWGPKLKKSTRFGKVVYHSRESIKRRKKPRVPEGQKLFNPNGTSPIKVQRYLNTINP